MGVMSIYGMREPARYAWVITKDHLWRDGDTGASDVGTMGPSDAPAELVERLNKGEGDTFKMYDDDRELYYTGRGLTLDDEWDENACYGPLGDFGKPNAGAVTIEWPGHRDRDCG